MPQCLSRRHKQAYTLEKNINPSKMLISVKLKYYHGANQLFCTSYDLRYFYNCLSIGKVLNLSMILYIFVQGDFIFAFFFYLKSLPPFLEKSKFGFFSNYSLFIRIYENLSTYLFYECFQFNASGNSAKNFGGKLTLKSSHVLMDAFFFRQTQFFGSSEVKTKLL